MIGIKQERSYSVAIKLKVLLRSSIKGRLSVVR